MCSISAKSKGTNWIDPRPLPASSSKVDLSWLDSFRATAMTRYPDCASLRLIARPSPRLPPVTSTSRMLTCQFTRGIEFQGRKDVYRRRNLMPGKHASTELQDLVLKIIRWDRRRDGFFREHDVSNHERPSDRVLLRPYQRHPNPGVPVDDGLYFLGMHLKAPNIDHSISSPDEIIAVTPQLEHVAGVNEAILASQGLVSVTDVTGGSPRGTNAKGAILDLHLHITAPLHEA